MPSTTNRLFHFNSKALENELPLLRADFDNLAAKSANGSGTEVMQRAEQVSAAIQRLEWALAKQQQQLRSRAARSGN